MIWIVLVILIGEIVIFFRLMLGYRQRANRLFIAQNPVKQRMEKHREKLRELAKQIRENAATGIEKLEMTIEQHTQQSGFAANTVAELDSEAREAEEEEEENGEGEEDIEEGEEGPTGEGIIGRTGAGVYTVDIDADRVKPMELVQSIRHELEDVYEYINGIGRDITIIRHTASRLGKEKDDGETSS